MRMHPNSMSVRDVASRLENVCFSCRRSLQQRRPYASAAAAVAEEPQSASKSDSDSIPSTGTKARPTYRLKAGVVLSRPPVLTRDLHPFEKAFFLYQRRLNERLALGFTRYFYYPAGSLEEVEWKRKIKNRSSAAREIGPYSAYGKFGWNDESLVGEPYSEPEHQMEALIQDAEDTDRPQEEGAQSVTPNGEEESEEGPKKVEIERPYPRTTEADKLNDETSLDRMLARSLYLLVKNSDGSWTFPSIIVRRGEGLRRGAERALEESAGVNMNTWIVGNNPVGHYAVNNEDNLVLGPDGVVDLGEKVFFMKARIMAGQADSTASTLGLKEFKWLAKEEIEKLVTPRYWAQTANMLTER